MQADRMYLASSLCCKIFCLSLVHNSQLQLSPVRAFELQLEASAPDDSKQQERVRSLFHRQLQIPMLDAADTLEAYRQWEQGKGGSVPPHVQKGFERAQASVELRQPYELAISGDQAADASLLASFHSYIQLEKAQGDPARVQLLYERALAVFPVTHELWLQYTKYLQQHLKIHRVTNDVYARAVRNCPWLGRLWAAALRALERGKCPAEEHGALYDRALLAGLQVRAACLAVASHVVVGVGIPGWSAATSRDYASQACEDRHYHFRNV